MIEYAFFFVVIWSHANYQVNYQEFGPYRSGQECASEAAIAAFEFQGASSNCYAKEIPYGRQQESAQSPKTRAEEEFLRYGP